jgi:hypothetical protein
LKRNDQQLEGKANMKNRKCILVGTMTSLALAVTVTVTPAYADKPEWAGKGKSKQSNDSRSGGRHFSDHQKVTVREYYTQEFRGGHCPPGLAKKNNGCMPPGQAKKWQVGRPLPRDVIFYDLPPRLVVELGTPPAGHKYVRVAADILMIAVGTSMVVDAIDDLSRM